MQWAVSQAVPFRRMHVLGNIVLHQKGGWASGGWMSDSLIDGNVGSGPQQQWISRNSEWASWTGANWNMVFVGIPHPPAGEWPTPPYTKVARTPIVREKPFLQVDAKGNWSVRVPNSQHRQSGHHLARRINTRPFDSSYPVLHCTFRQRHRRHHQCPTRAGQNLLLTPGIYDLDEPIRITRPNTVVMGLGFATLRPSNGTAAITTADADGIDIAGLLIDAGEQTSPVLVEIGPKGSHARHARNPIFLHDVFFRVGGAGVGRAQVNLESTPTTPSSTTPGSGAPTTAPVSAGPATSAPTASSSTAITSPPTGFSSSITSNSRCFGTATHGRTYFYQSEIPYDPPDQPSYTSAPGTNGWASYKVADNVTSHEAWGLGIYSVFRHPNVVLTRAIEVPITPNVRFHHMITVALDNLGEISNVIDDKGGPTHVAPNRVTPKVADFPQ